MKLEHARVLLTGAAGGIGSAIATALAAEGSRLLLVDRSGQALDALTHRLGEAAPRHETLTADLTDPAARAHVAEVARKWEGGIDVLINNAGIADFALLAEQDEARIAQLLQINTLMPILLTRALLPALEAQPRACVLNLGSILGHIGHPGYAAYGASKAALASFSEALRRECAAGPVRVLYLAPRATRTALNSPAVERMNEALGVASDPPQVVARALVSALRRERPRTLLGGPEPLFVRINALLPRLVDRSFRAKLAVIRRWAARESS